LGEFGVGIWSEFGVRVEIWGEIWCQSINVHAECSWR